MIIKKTEGGGKRPQMRTAGRMPKKKMGSQKFDAMSMDFAGQQKQQELEMKKKSEGEPDLGYIGSFSGMKCGKLDAVGDRLECNYDKWKYDDPLAKMEVKRRALQRKRQGRHKFAIQRMCMEEAPLLCAKKDRDDIEKEQEPKCLELNACPEPGSRLSDIPKDAKEFYKILIKAMSFGKKKKGKKRGKSTKELTKLRNKMKKELQQIKEEYDSLLSAQGGDAAPAKGAPAKGAPAKGGSMNTYIDPSRAFDIYKKQRDTSPMSYDYGSGGGESKSFDKQTGTASCQGKVAIGKFDKDWKNYKKCVLDYQEGAPKDGKEIIDSTKEKFKTAPLIPRHLELLEKYHRKKKLMDKTTGSASQKLKALKKKARGKLAAYKVTAQKAKNDAKKMGKAIKSLKQGAISSNKQTIKNREKIRQNPQLAAKVNKKASDAAQKKLDKINARRASKGQPPLSKDDSKNFMKKEKAIQKNKLIENAGEMKKLRREDRREKITSLATSKGLNVSTLKGSKKSTLKNLQKMEGKEKKKAEKYIKQGMDASAAKNLANKFMKKQANTLGVDMRSFKTGMFRSKSKRLDKIADAKKFEARMVASGVDPSKAKEMARAKLESGRLVKGRVRDKAKEERNKMFKNTFGTDYLQSGKQAKRYLSAMQKGKEAGLKGNTLSAFAKQRTSGRTRLGRSSELDKNFKQKLEKDFGKGMRFKARNALKVAKNREKFQKSDEAAMLKKDMMSRGFNEKQAMASINSMAMKRAVAKTKSSITQRTKKGNIKKNIKQEMKDVLGTNRGIRTQKALGQMLKRREQATKEAKQAADKLGIDTTSKKGKDWLQKYSAARANEKYTSRFKGKKSDMKSKREDLQGKAQLQNDLKQSLIQQKMKSSGMTKEQATQFVNKYANPDVKLKAKQANKFSSDYKRLQREGLSSVDAYTMSMTKARARSSGAKEGKGKKYLGLGKQKMSDKGRNELRALTKDFTGAIGRKKLDKAIADKKKIESTSKDLKERYERIGKDTKGVDFKKLATNVIKAKSGKKWFYSKKNKARKKEDRKQGLEGIEKQTGLKRSRLNKQLSQIESAKKLLESKGMNSKKALEFAELRQSYKTGKKSKKETKAIKKEMKTKFDASTLSKQKNMTELKKLMGNKEFSSYKSLTKNQRQKEGYKKKSKNQLKLEKKASNVASNLQKRGMSKEDAEQFAQLRKAKKINKTTKTKKALINATNSKGMKQGFQLTLKGQKVALEKAKKLQKSYENLGFTPEEARKKAQKISGLVQQKRDKNVVGSWRKKTLKRKSNIVDNLFNQGAQSTKKETKNVLKNAEKLKELGMNGKEALKYANNSKSRQFYKNYNSETANYVKGKFRKQGREKTAEKQIKKLQLAKNLANTGVMTKNEANDYAQKLYKSKIKSKKGSRNTAEILKEFKNKGLKTTGKKQLKKASAIKEMMNSGMTQNEASAYFRDKAEKSWRGKTKFQKTAEKGIEKTKIKKELMDLGMSSLNADKRAQLQVNKKKKFFKKNIRKNIENQDFESTLEGEKFKLKSNPDFIKKQAQALVEQSKTQNVQPEPSPSIKPSNISITNSKKKIAEMSNISRKAKTKTKNSLNQIKEEAIQREAQRQKKASQDRIQEAERKIKEAKEKALKNKLTPDVSGNLQKTAEQRAKNIRTARKQGSTNTANSIVKNSNNKRLQEQIKAQQAQEAAKQAQEAAKQAQEATKQEQEQETQQDEQQDSTNTTSSSTSSSTKQEKNEGIGSESDEENIQVTPSTSTTTSKPTALKIKQQQQGAPVSTNQGIVV